MAALPRSLSIKSAALALLLGAAAPPDAATEARLQAAAQVRQADDAVSDAAQRVSALAAQRQKAEARLQEQAAALAPLLPLAERLQLFPAETLLAVPVPADQAVRGLAVLQGLTRTVQARAAAVRAELAKVEQARQELDQALPKLRAAQAEQRLRAAQLDRQVEQARAERARADDAAADEARRAAAEATRADSVAGALETMATSRVRTEQLLQQDAERAMRQRRTVALMLAQKRAAEIAAPRGPGIQPGGGAILPVAGPVVRRWGEPTEAGPAHGMAFRPPPNGRVVSPCAGRVAFAGPFRSYGTVVILDCGGKFHFVLAGMDRLDVEAGAAVRPGDPVGSMPDWDPAGAGPRPALYLELRHGGEAVDPAPYLRPAS
ncbi:MAG: peptidoglycan DD-metalloendopeptidase family protein [Acetobacteraceae bacterium]|nr:peptidoglycan DD-metalloendopeptidase family protein [Acetobacteraceae bacterium]